MSSDWTEVSLQEVTSKLGDGLHGTPNYDDNGEYFFINGNNLGSGRIVVDEKTKRVAATEYLKHKKDIGDRTILVSINGTIGNVALYSGEKVVLGKSACYFNVVDSVDKQYVRYVVTGEYFQNYIRTLATGSTIKNVSLKLMRDFRFHLPPIEIQRKISKTLEDLDNKIELNRQINQTLEQIAQALFKSWFVDFEPTRAKIAAKEVGASPEEIERAAMCAISGKTPDQLAQLPPETQQNLKTTAALFPDALVDSELGEVPEGWVVESLDKFIDVKHGFAFQGEFFTDVDTHKILLSPGNFKIGGGFKLDKFKYYSGDVPEDYILKKRDLLITMTDLSKEADTLGFPALIPEHDEVIFLHNQRLGKVIGKHEQLRRYFFYCLFRTQRYRQEIISGITGTTVKHTAPRKILAFTHPFCQDLEKVFDDFASKIFSNIECLELQNSSLKTLRDTLLPKLLSGEIQIQNNEETINV